MQRHFLQFLLFCSLTLLVLSGCGGGGGGKPHISGKVPNLKEFTKWSETPSPGLMGIDGTAQTGSYTSTSVRDDALADAHVTIAYDKDGKILAITLKTHETDLAWDTTKGDTIDTDGEYYFLNSKNGQINAKVSDPDDPNLPLEYQTYGVWMSELPNDSGKFGAISMGAQTLASAIPKTGSADFSGSSEGIYIDSAGKYETVSDVGVHADFFKMELKFSTNNTFADNLDTAENYVAAPDLDMTGTLTYKPGNNTFSGDVNAQNLSGKSTGHFYGPKAEELGGVFDLSGTNQTYIGAYGAKK